MEDKNLENNEKPELTEEQLENVTGGISRYDGYCPKNWKKKDELLCKYCSEDPAKCTNDSWN